MTYIKPSNNIADYKDFMNTWTIFYWGWWISWAPFVGTFIAKISRGRTIREFITATIIVPIIYILIRSTFSEHSESRVNASRKLRQHRLHSTKNALGYFQD